MDCQVEIDPVLDALLQSSMAKYQPVAKVTKMFDGQKLMVKTVCDAPVEETVTPIVKPEMKVKTEVAKKDDAEKVARTVFIGNLPISSIEKRGTGLKSKLSEFGKLQSIRFRSVALQVPLKDGERRKMEIRNGNFHAEKDTVNAYAVFQNVESAVKCCAELNGTVYEGKHLRVDSCTPKTFDHKRSVFIGNLPFDIKEEALWTHFEKCGTIEGVRIVRDKISNLGKGFAYVAFTDRASAAVALTMNESECCSRKIRVDKCTKLASKDSTEKFRGQKSSLSGAERRIEKKTKKPAVNKKRKRDEDTDKVSKKRKRDEDTGKVSKKRKVVEKKSPPKRSKEKYNNVMKADKPRVKKPRHVPRVKKAD